MEIIIVDIGLGLLQRGSSFLSRWKDLGKKCIFAFLRKKTHEILWHSSPWYEVSDIIFIDSPKYNYRICKLFKHTYIDITFCNFLNVQMVIKFWIKDLEIMKEINITCPKINTALQMGTHPFQIHIMAVSGRYFVGIPYI